MSEKYREIDIMPYYLMVQILLEVPKNSFTKDEYVLFITKIKSHEKVRLIIINNIKTFRRLSGEGKKNYKKKSIGR